MSTSVKHHTDGNGTITSEFGARLYKARTFAKMSQKTLANTVGMAQSTYGKLELEGKGSSYTPKIAEACGVSVMWLAHGQGEMFGAPTAHSGGLPKAMASLACDPLFDTRTLYGKEIVEMLAQFKDRSQLNMAFARIVGVVDAYSAELAAKALAEPHVPSAERRQPNVSEPTQKPVRHQ